MAIGRNDADVNNSSDNIMCLINGSTRFEAAREHRCPEPMLGRVVGVGGDTIEIQSNRLYINGEKYNEDDILTPQLNRHPKTDNQ